MGVPGEVCRAEGDGVIICCETPVATWLASAPAERARIQIPARRKDSTIALLGPIDEARTARMRTTPSAIVEK